MITLTAMTSLTVATINTRIDEEPPALARKILRNLRERKLYDPNLMYRGINAEDEQIGKIAIYGTDRNPEDAGRRLTEDIYESLSLIEHMRKIQGIEENHIRGALSEDSDPSLIWAFPREGLEECIDTYALDGDEKPVILVYKPEFLVFAYKGHMWDGKRVPELIKSFGRAALADESFPLYRFKEGVKPIDAAVIAYILKSR